MVFPDLTMYWTYITNGSINVSSLTVPFKKLNAGSALMMPVYTLFHE